MQACNYQSVETIVAETRDKLEATTLDYLAGQRHRLIQSHLIERPITKKIVDGILNSGQSTDTLLTSAAGGGKSACTFQIIEQLHAENMPVLAFRLDRVQVVANTIELGKELGQLSNSPVAAMHHAYPEKPFTIVIDQLDAVSFVSARKAELFDTVAALCQEIQALRLRRKVHLILVCRKFDYDHDFRLKRLLGENEKPKEIPPLNDSDVESVIKNAGGDYSRLNEKQKSLLRLPQNLSLMCDTGANEWNKDFSSQKELFDAYWSAKKKAVEKDHPQFLGLWSKFISHLAEEISRKEELSISETALDEFPSNLLDSLASEGVISKDGKRYGFGHETFFDYCYARILVADGRDFIEFLKTDRQYLFRRSQLRQCLVFLRDDDFTQYLKCAEKLINSEDIRAHLKLLTVEIIANQEHPRDEELNILLPFIKAELDLIIKESPSTDKIANRIFATFVSSRNLFLPADRLGLIESWISSKDPILLDWVANYLSWQTHQHAERVAELIESKLDVSTDWNQRLLRIVTGHDLAKSRRLFDLYLAIFDKGLLDGDENTSNVWDLTHSFADEAPEWSVELIAKWLSRQIHIHENDNDFQRNRDHSGVRNITQSAKNAPKAFIQQVLPLILQAAGQFTYPTRDDTLTRDKLWTWRMKGSVTDIHEALLIGCETAIATLRSEDLQLLEELADTLKIHQRYTANCLLMSVYQAAPEPFADDALRLLSAEPKRFHCGYTDSTYWDARKVIKKCSPHCSDEVFELIETTTSNYLTDYEQSKDGWKLRGQAAYTLTSALAEERRKSETNSRILTWEDKFGTPERPPRGVRGGTVTSPIPHEKAEKMTDVQWLGAIRKYASEDRPWRYSDFLKGGSLERARALEKITKEDPHRFAGLFFKLPDEAHSNYYSHIIRGLIGSELDFDVYIKIARKVFSYADDEIRKVTVDLLGSIKNGMLPNDCIEYLHDSAVNHTDPENESWDGEKGYYGGCILTAGINTVRGRTMEAIRNLIFRSRDYFEAFTKTINLSVKDSSLSVRCCTASAIRAATLYDEPLALKWTTQIVNADDRLLGTRYLTDLITCFFPSYLKEVSPIIVRMLDSEVDSVRESGGLMACLAKLYNKDAESLSEKALNGDLNNQKGAVKVANQNILLPDCKEWCEYALNKLFHSPHTEILKSSAHCFWAHWTKDEANIQDYKELIANFVQSPAFLEDPTYLLHALEKSKDKLPEVSLEVCEMFIKELSEEARDIRTSRAANESEVGKLVFSIYAQMDQPELKERALNLIDQMCLEGLHSSHTQLSEHDR
ncbi:MAG: hypothetical protein ACSHYA_19205 [Opitutaceae bacterium]